MAQGSGLFWLAEAGLPAHTCEREQVPLTHSGCNKGKKRQGCWAARRADLHLSNLIKKMRCIIGIRKWWQGGHGGVKAFALGLQTRKNLDRYTGLLWEEGTTGWCVLRWSNYNGLNIWKCSLEPAPQRPWVLGCRCWLLLGSQRKTTGALHLEGRKLDPIRAFERWISQLHALCPGRAWRERFSHPGNR